MQIRTAQGKDNQAIISLLKELDLYYSAIKIKDFWVAEENKQIIGAAQLLDCGEFLFLSSVGVDQKHQKHGVAKKLLNKLLTKQDKEIYLYTIIPDFFRRFGFEITTTLPQNLPSKDRYECADCYPERCVTMVGLKGIRAPR